MMRALPALALVPLFSAAAPQEDYAEPYRILQRPAGLSIPRWPPQPMRRTAP